MLDIINRFPRVFISYSSHLSGVTAYPLRLAYVQPRVFTAVLPQVLRTEAKRGHPDRA